jgi:hypothetical protein
MTDHAAPQMQMKAAASESYCPIGPSTRRPVDVKTHFRFLLSVTLFPFGRAGSVAILPSALFGERCSLGARWVFLFQQVLLPDNRPLFPPFPGELGARLGG